MSAAPAPSAENRVVDSVRTMLGLGGIIALVVGILIMLNPVKSGAIVLQIVAGVVAIYAVGVGAVYLGSAIFSKTMQGWPRTGNILLGLLYIAGGILLFANLSAAATVLAVLLSILVGVLWVVEGIIALTTLKVTGRKGLTILYAAVSIIAGVVLIVSPLIAAVTLWVLLGISMIVMGAIQVVRAFFLKA